jgi:hypothetical protein
MYFAGAMRDGSLPKPYMGHYEITISQKYINWLNKIIIPIFIESFKIRKQKIRIKQDNNTPRIVIYSKEFYFKLKNFLDHNLEDWKTPGFVLNTTKLKKWYVCGFFDAEGEVPHVEEYLSGKYSTKPRLRIRFHQCNHKNQIPNSLLDLISFLKILDINCGNITGPKRNKNTFDFDLPITGTETKKFYEKIGTFHPMKDKRFKLLFKLYNL